MNTIRADNFSQAELDKFNELAHRWWDPEGPQKARSRVICTDLPDRFRAVAERFLGRKVADVEQVDLLER